MAHTCLLNSRTGNAHPIICTVAQSNRLVLYFMLLLLFMFLLFGHLKYCQQAVATGRCGNAGKQIEREVEEQSGSMVFIAYSGCTVA